LTQDNAVLSEHATALFAEIESGVTDVYLAESVLVEAEQVLSSASLYHLARSDVYEALDRVIDLPGVTVSFRSSYHRALDLYLRHNPLSLMDCLCIAHAERLRAVGIVSFDRGYDGAAVRAETAVRRSEPGSAAPRI